MNPPAAAAALALLLAGATLATVAPAGAAGQSAAIVPRAPVPIVLPHAPPAVDPISGTLFDALLAIERARAVDPQAAQNAAFSYVAAVQQYRSGNFAAARISALQALSIAGATQVPVAPGAPLLTPSSAPFVPPQAPGTAGGLYGADAPAIDAASFLALARGTLDDCAARHDPRLSAVRGKLAQAERDFAARDWEATRRAAKAAIDACAKD